MRNRRSTVGQRFTPAVAKIYNISKTAKATALRKNIFIIPVKKQTYIFSDKSASF